MITTLLFDLDNTLYSPSFGMEDDVIRRMNEYVVRVLGKSLDECRKIRSERLPHYGTTLEWLMAEHGVTDTEDYFAYVHPEGEELVLRREPEVQAALEALLYPKYILTNAPMEHADRVLRVLGLAEYFTGIYDIRFNKLKGKPHQEAYLRVCADMGVSTDEVLFVDDIPRYANGFTEVGGTGVLIDQFGKHKGYGGTKIQALGELTALLGKKGD